MRIESVLRRAWHMVRHYRALWVFGCVLALTVFSWAPALLSPQGVDSHLPALEWGWPRDSSWRPSLSTGWQYRCVDIGPWGPVCGWSLQTDEWSRLPAEIVTVLTIAAAVLGVLGLLFILGQIARYVAEPALIRMVDGYERTGQRSTFRQGLRMGWSRTAWRFLGIDLLLDMLVWLGAGTLLSLAAVPLLPWSLGWQPFPGAGAALVTGSISLVSFALFILVGVSLAVIKPLARRACALENLRVIPSIRQGFRLARQHLKEVGTLWLVVLGVQVGYAIAIIPIVILLLGVGGLLGGGLTLLVHSLAVPAWPEVTAWAVSALAGGSVFVLVLTVPLAFLGGLREVLVSSSWTLTYREVCAQESRAPQAARPAQDIQLGDTVAG